MATAVALKEKTLEWSKIFPTKFSQLSQSKVFIKKLFAVAVSNVLYLRMIFPEHAFIDKQLEGINLKIIREDNQFPSATKIISWVRGCFDALDKHYLKTVLIGLFSDPSDPHTVIESYSFKFSYKDDGDAMTIDISSENQLGEHSIAKSVHSADEIRKSTIQLLRTMILATNTLGPLPSNLMMTMKLLYFDNITPPDYEPPGFKAADYAGFRTLTETVDVRVGNVETDFHGFSMAFKLDKENLDAQLLSLSDSREKSMSISGKQSDQGDNSGKRLSRSNVIVSPKGDNSITPGNGSSKSLVNCRIGTPQKALQDKDNNNLGDDVEDDETFVVRCPCGYNKDENMMIVCFNCKLWQHGCCFRIIKDDDAPAIHICDLCAAENTNLLSAGRTDKTLLQMSIVERQSVCLFRRSLMLCMEVEKISLNQMMKELGTESCVCQGLMKQLEREGVLKTLTGRQRKDQMKIVNRQYLVDIVIPRVFYDFDVTLQQTTTEMEDLASKTGKIAVTINQEKSAKKRTSDQLPLDQTNKTDIVSPPVKRTRASMIRTPLHV